MKVFGILSLLSFFLINQTTANDDTLQNSLSINSDNIQLPELVESTIDLVSISATDNDSFARSEKTKNGNLNHKEPSDTPNFQSFEEWKKNKLLQDELSPENSNIESIDLLNNSETSSPPTTSLLSTIPPKLMQRTKGDSSKGLKYRDSRNGNNNLEKDESIGEEMEIELSMFSGTSEEQGKLYKERFNFASFDCAATIVKTNKEAKGANSILIDNKDSYLLNECNAQNKFIIIELCEDILVDEILIGNYEFYSSMFKNLKISVSARFPTNQWINLGEFQAENIRKLQIFKIENPLIWAKFLKVEFLTHYGNEFYCPISSVQVHGKTMIEQFKEENPEVEEVGDSNLIKSNEIKYEMDIPKFNVNLTNNLNTTFKIINDDDDNGNDTHSNSECSIEYLKLEQFLNKYESKIELSDQCLVDLETTTTVQQTKIQQPQPQIQDSIYKNIVKRLILLESNATLSLLYIEEQSKLLSEAFKKLETEQNLKFQNILVQLNSTIQSQMDIFQKLNVDVYESFSRLFEYQQQNFESSNSEILNEVNMIKKSISMYKKLLIFLILLIIILFVYILLTKDLLYIDEQYFSKILNNNSNRSSTLDWPNISPTNSAINLKSIAKNRKTLSKNRDFEYDIDYIIEGQ